MRSEGSCPPTAARTAYPRTHARRGSGKGLDSAAGGAIADGIAGRASLRALEIRCRPRAALPPPPPLPLGPIAPDRAGPIGCSIHWSTFFDIRAYAEGGVRRRLKAEWGHLGPWRLEGGAPFGLSV